MKFINRKSLSFLFISIVFLFIGRIIYKEWNRVLGYHWSLEPSWLIVSLIIAFIAYLFSAIEWVLVLKMVGGKIKWSKGVVIYLLSLFGRYIPGGVWSPLGRIYLCRFEGIPDSQSSISIILEQAYPVVSAGLVFAVSLFFWTETISVVNILPLILIFPFFFLFLHPKPFLKIVNPLLLKLKKKEIQVSLSGKYMLILITLYTFNWIVLGTSFYFFINAFYNLNPFYIYIPVLSGISALSFIIGYLSFFSPAGLGVREGVLIILLSHFMPTPIAIGVSLLSRLWSLGSELIILVLFIINAKTRRLLRTAIGWK